MKPFKNYAGALCLLLCIPFINYAQFNVSAPTQRSEEFNYAIDTTHFESNVRLNEINTSAFRSFLKDYPDAVNEKWFNDSKGSCAVFINNNITYKIFYNKHGGFILSLKYYAGESLDETIQHTMATRFPGAAIKSVTEAYDGHLTEHEICMTKKSSTIICKLIAGEISDITELSAH